MKDAGIYSDKDYQLLLTEIDQKINIDWDKAEKAEFPREDFLFKPVYSN